MATVGGGMRKQRRQLTVAGIGFALLLVVTVVAASALGWSMYLGLRDIDTFWERQNYTMVSKALARKELSESLGYGGFIHKFKNYVLRQDGRLVPRIRADIHRALSAIQHYRNMRISNGEANALIDLEQVIKEYRDNIDIAVRSVASGLPPTEIDAMVKVDDGPAIDSLAYLDAALINERWSAIDDSGGSIDDLIPRLGLAPFLLPALIVAGVGIIWFQRRLLKAVDESALQRGFFQVVIDSVPDALMITDHDRKIILCNPAAQNVFGYGRGELKDLHSGILYVSDEEVDQHGLSRLSADGVNAHTSQVINYRRKDGGSFRGETVATPIKNQSDEAVAYLSVIRDVTERERSVQQVLKLSQAVEQSPASVIIADPSGTIEYANAKFLEVTGREAGEVIGRHLNVISVQDSHPPMTRSLWETLSTDWRWSGELQSRKKNGDPYWQHVSFSPILTEEGEIRHFVGVAEDITLRKEYEERLFRQANFDNITGLPNRTLALDRLSQALSRGRRQGLKTGMLFVDLDRFKNVNDTIGHDSGDRLLRQAAERLRECVREVDTVARFGGDEFIVVLPDIHAAGDAERVASKILRAFSRPFPINDHVITVTASIGISLSPDDGEDAQVLMRNADAAMYRVKDLGRNSFHFFTPSLDEEIQRRLKIETRLHMARERNELSLHYQPIVHPETGGLFGAEALLRWQNSELGELAPGEFVPVAEEIGQIAAIGEWVLRNACRQAKEWRTRGMDLSRISVNVSGHQLRDPTFVDTVAAILEETGLTPGLLELEFTEGVLLADLPEVEETVRRLDALGVRLSVDDFGTGYSSLSYLRRFPVDTLKIDQSFIRDLTRDPNDARLVEAIIALGRSLDLAVVAEGVETASELAFLRSHGCDLVQGFACGRPLSVEQFSRQATTPNSVN